MQTRNKAVIVGLVAGSIVWNTTRVLPYGIEAGVLACWAGCLSDIDAAYEFAGDHTKYPPAALSLPFGRTIADRVQSMTPIKFLHSIIGVIAFVVLGQLITLLPSTIYARFQMFFAGWIIYFVAKYLFKAILRHPLRGIIRVTLVFFALTGFGIWEFIHGRFSWFHPLPAHWFVLTLLLGFGGSVVLELLSSRGIPLLWPLPQNFKIPIFAETGGVREVIIVVTFVGLWCCWWWYHYPTFHFIAWNFDGLLHAIYQEGVAKVASLF
ncbi:MAG: metal-dependent hydrolase [Ferrimicrobium acidiphilum]